MRYSTGILHVSHDIYACVCIICMHIYIYYMCVYIGCIIFYRREASIGLIVIYVIHVQAALHSTSPAGKVMWQ